MIVMNLTHRTSNAHVASYGSVHVRVRPETGTLYLDFFIEGQRQRKSSGLPDTTANRRKLEAEARRLAAAKLLGTLPAQTTPPGTSPVPTFAAFAERWLVRCRPQWRPSTQVQMRGLVMRYLMPVLEDRPVDQIDRGNVLDLRLSLNDGDEDQAPLAVRTLNETMRVLRAILAEAAREYGHADPAADLRTLKTSLSSVEPFTAPELAAIRRCIDPQYRTLFEVWLATGLRTGEVLGLRWRHVDFGRGCLHIEVTATDLGPGRPKTEAGCREVRVGTALLEILRGHQPLISDPDALVFTTQGGNAIDRHNFARRVWGPGLRDAGVKHRRPYLVRHTFASMALASGETPAFVSKQLGHSTLAEVYGTYGRFIPQHRAVDGYRVDTAFADILS